MDSASPCCPLQCEQCCVLFKLLPEQKCWKFHFSCFCLWKGILRSNWRKANNFVRFVPSWEQNQQTNQFLNAWMISRIGCIIKHGLLLVMPFTRCRRNQKTGKDTTDKADILLILYFCFCTLYMNIEIYGRNMHACLC